MGGAYETIFLKRFFQRSDMHSVWTSGKEKRFQRFHSFQRFQRLLRRWWSVSMREEITVGKPVELLELLELLEPLELLERMKPLKPSLNFERFVIFSFFCGSEDQL
ncbi:MAG: hypothetical protein DI535_12080 [Citrobacter freundii]|nr:MAG: hypothetical protein DI535_12080 [Citrobacter freundii]